jgi:ATP-dependent Lon protease
MSNLKHISDSDYLDDDSEYSSSDSSSDEESKKKNKLTKEGYLIDNFVVDNKKRKLNDYDCDDYCENELIKASKQDPLLKKIKNAIDDKKITLEKISKSKISFDEKVNLTEKYLILQTIPLETEDYNNLRDYINNKLNSNIELTDDDLLTEENLKEINKTNVSLKERILKAKFNNKTKALIYRRYELMLEACAEDKQKYKEWIDWSLSIPEESINLFNGDRTLLKNLKELKKLMNKKLYGMFDVKERVLEIVTGMYTNTNSNNRCITLTGPPGVGKTVLAQCIAESLNLPFVQISLGGAKDSSFLRGHSSVYIGSKPGVIVNALKRFNCNNGVIFFDELDKIQNTPEGTEVKSTLLHILDYSQNHDFRDDYMPEIPIDLSKIFFILSQNSLNIESDVDEILMDRMPLINLNGYNMNDRIKIGLNYLVPKIMNNLGINNKDIIINEKAITYIIKKQNIQEYGVRQLERNLHNILQKINLLRMHKKDKKKNNILDLSYYLEDFKLPFTLKKKHINELFNEYE